MSIKITSMVWEDAPYEGRKLLVLMALSDHANDQGICWPSVETLQRKARCSERLVREALAQFEKDGWVTRKFNEGKTTTYTITPKPRGAENAGVQLGAETLPRSCPQNHKEPSTTDVDVVQLPKRARSWNPSPGYYQRGIEIINIWGDVEDYIDHYLNRLKMTGRTKKPSDEEWLTWLIRDENEAKARDRREARNTGPTVDDSGTPLSWRL